MFRPLLILHIHWLLLLPAFMAVVAEPTTMVTAPNTAKPGCQQKCGNLIVPYPFGIGLEGKCSFNSHYDINCDETFNPPKAFIGNGNLEIMDIEPTKMRIKNTVATRCDANSSGGTWTHLRSRQYFLSDTDNKLVVIGCNDLGLITGTSGRNFSRGCATICATGEDVRAGSCSGLGCCQTSIPKGMKSHSITLKVADDKLADYYCGHAFLAEADRFVFHGITDLSNSDLFEARATDIPIVLEWLIAEQESCSEAQQNKTAFACQNNTSCIDIDTDDSGGGGYQCSCFSGYEGNPYLSPGCIDINECEGSENPCSHVCTNTLGSYYCSCWKGFHGDGLKNGTGCSASLALHQDKVIIVAVPSIGLGTIVLFLLSFWLCLVLRKRKQIRRKAKHFERNGGLLLQQKMTSSHGVVDKTKVFTADELEKATDNFHEDRILGQGGQGTVYKGMLTDGRIVAIKKSKKIDESQLGQFINELVILSQINHRNIVKLLGCCLETEVPTLVYEFIQNGTLSQQIHSPSDELPITWEMRLQIAADSAGALAYLHSASSFPIYHRDIKTSNILLDEKYRGKVSDFGISRLVPIDDTHLTVTNVFGTYGYMDPEYFQSRMFTEKSDVYSFGVVLLELLTGKRPIQPTNNASQERMSLVAWFLAAMKHLCQDDIFDQVIRTDKQEELFAVANLAMRCLDMDSKRRPTMKEVAAELEAIKAHNFSYSFEQNLSEIDEHPSFESDVGEGTYGYSSTSILYLDFSSPSVDTKPLC